MSGVNASDSLPHTVARRARSGVFPFGGARQENALVGAEPRTEAATAMATRRLQKELMDLRREPIEGVTADPLAGDLFNWVAMVHGPPDSPYENGCWEISIELQADYPFKPPKVVFLTPIFHPNINGRNICIDILQSQWSPALTISKVLLCIQSLMWNPVTDDPLVPDIALLCKLDRARFETAAREMTARFAMGRTADDEPDELPSLFALAAARLRTLKHVPETMHEAVQLARPKLGKELLPDPRGSKRKHDDRAEAEAARLYSNVTRAFHKRWQGSVTGPRELRALD